MGILLGWIVQRRWLTLTAFLVTLVGAFTLPRLPVPYSYLFVLPPALLLAAIIFEISGLFGFRISRRVRLAWALWMGFSGLVLMVGVVVSGSNPIILIATIAVFTAMTMPSIFFVGIRHAQGLRQDQAR